MKAKSRKVWPLALLALLVIPMMGCSWLDRLINPPTLNSQQAIALVQVAGLPSIDHYYEQTVGEEQAQATGKIGTATPIPEWSASYEGDGNWRVEGPVSTEKWGTCMTVWTISESESKIALIGFGCQ